MSKRNNNDLLREAIADAKAVRETALANAKIALQEAFTPKLQSMFSSRLRNEVDNDFDANPVTEVETATGNGGDDPEAEKAGAVDGQGGHGLEKQGPNSKNVLHEDGEENDEEDAISDPTDPTAVGAAGADDGDAMGIDVTGAEEIPADGEVAAGMGPGEDEDNTELETIIRELDAEENPELEDPTLAPDDEEGEEDATLGIPSEATDVTVNSGDDPEQGLAGNVGSPEAGMEAPEVGIEPVAGEEDELDLESLVKEVEDELSAGDKKEDEEEFAGKFEGLRKENIQLAKSLKEHRTVITFLRSKLNEINLLNAKLLFSNKLFRSNNLSESQKLRVVETIDRANTIREVKLVFATLAESLKMKSTPLTESKSRPANRNSASASIGSTRPTTTVLNEGTELAARFKRLAGIKKISRIL